jgi:hypothetical protein
VKNTHVRESKKFRHRPGGETVLVSIIGPASSARKSQYRAAATPQRPRAV